MVDVGTVSVVVVAASVVVGVVFAVLQLRDLVKQRQTDLVISLYSIFSSKEFQKEWHMIMTDMENKQYKYNELLEKYGVEAPMAGFFFEGVGVLLHKKLVNVGLVDDLFSGYVKRLWERGKPFIEDARRQLDYPQYAEWFEYLYNEMQKRQQKQ